MAATATRPSPNATTPTWLDTHDLKAPLNDPLDERFAAIVDELTRRGFLAAGAGAVAVAGLDACGPSGSPDDTPAGSATRRVTTPDGSITVPTHPTQVVSVDYFTGIFLVELGLVPAGGIDYSWVDPSTMYPPYVPILKKIPDIGQITSTDIEKVAALHPDLILGPTPGSRYDNSKGAIPKLKSLAPVGTVDFDQTGDWRGPLHQAAQLVNRTDQLQPIATAYQNAIDAAKTRYADLLATTVVSILDYSQDGTFALDLPRSTDGVMLADLGVRFGQASADNGTSTRELSVERIDDLADSDLILYRADATGTPTNGLQDVVKLQSWKNLPAVRAGHAYPIGWADLCTYRWARAALNSFTTILTRYHQDLR
ncbi:MAG: ABC transporter substrate-binding protein [Nocardioides sp.]